MANILATVDDMNEPMDEKTLAEACIELSSDPCLGRVYNSYGVPPLWDRPQGFATLLQIILEQQVSLASAKACFDKLTARLTEVTPETLLSLDDDELRAIGFSRQKTGYARCLAEAVQNGEIEFSSLSELPDPEVRRKLVALKGIGNWTSDIYLLMALLRPDIMPLGDIALHSAWQKLSGKQLTSPQDLISVAERWAPFRSAAARLLWHFYLSEREERKRWTL